VRHSFIRAATLIAVLGAVFAAFSQPAGAAVPCWKKLMNDWYSPPISSTYPIPCYHDAIKHLPLDVREYSNARDDIERALAQAIANHNGKNVTTTIGTTTETFKPGAAPPPPTTTPKKKRNPFSNAIRHVTPGGADAFPLPLLILGLLAILLVLAGVGGMIWRRYQGPPGTA
jgi:hypothetical protein